MRFLVALLLAAVLQAGEARYARLGEFAGPVEVQLTAADPWTAAQRNLPLPEGAWLRTGASARVEIEFDDGSAWRLGADSSGAISDYTRLSTGQRIALLSLDRGLAYVTANPKDKDSLIAAVPGAEVTFTGAARVRLEAGDGWSRISVLEGAVRFSSPAAEIGLVAGQTTRVEPSNPSRFGFEREVTAMTLDAWSAARDRVLASSTSSLHVVAHYGLADLDTSGEWIQTEEFGVVWKPKAAENWTPFQNGHWLWYDALGYTWVSGDAWGWLPYHYGRWSHSATAGWVWAPDLSQVFKPGEVFWLRGAKLAGWGPLAPGERWRAEGGALPLQFANLYSTWAAFEPGARLIDPAGFTGRPEDPLKVAALAASLPSPAFETARLEAVRPLTAANGTHVSPAIPGVSYDESAVQETPGAPAVVDTSASYATAPVVIVTAPPDDQPPPDPVLIPYPVAVYGGLVVKSSRTTTTPAVAPAKTQAPPSAPARHDPPPPLPERPGRRPTARELAVYEDALKQNEHPERQIEALDRWTREFPQTDMEADRLFLYAQAYNRVTPPQPAKVIEYGDGYLRRGPSTLPEDPAIGAARHLSVLYSITVSAGLLAQPTRDQVRIARDAARQLEATIPGFFDGGQKPAGVSDELWAKARADMEAAAKHTLRITAQAGPKH